MVGNDSALSFIFGVTANVRSKRAPRPSFRLGIHVSDVVF